ncbi:MAG TPA: hypothetical protein VKZ53_19280 [Candidatus Angelobacter sp.]|nr:hypothetical protein [Candidatus Angelobacter sp.]
MADKYSLQVGNSVLEYRDTAGALRWSLPAKSVVLIAEYTTNEGPYVDDYFLVFTTVEDGTLYSSTCSFYADGVFDTLKTLQEHLGAPIQLGLAASTEWRSRVVWPADMADVEYFTFKDVPAKSLFDRIKAKIVGPTQEYAISMAIREYLERKRLAALALSPDI